MRTKDVLISDYAHPKLITGLQALGYAVTYAPEMGRKEMEAALPSYTGVVINTRCAIDRAAMLSTEQLKWIARLGSGLDIIDLTTAAERGINVISAPEGNARAVAEHALAMLLNLCNKLCSADRRVREGYWLREEHRGIELEGKTIGLIGYGNNGRAFGKVLRGLDMRILVYDKYVHGFEDTWIIETGLEELLAESDIISLHIPLTPETNGLVNSHFLEKCKDGCILINTSRGKNLDLSAVVEALHTGKIGGACIDVFPAEPPQSGSEEIKEAFEKLIKSDNVVLTPHVAGWTVQSKEKIADVLLQKISRM